MLPGFASHNTRIRMDGNTLYNNETVEWGYDGIHSSELYTQHAVNIIENHNKNVVCSLFNEYIIEKFQTHKIAECGKYIYY